MIQESVQKKKYSFGGNLNAEAISQSENRPMILIGG